MIKTIILDFGNVVAFFDHQRAIDKIKPLTPLSSAEIRKRIYEGNLEDDYEAGRISTAEFVETVRRICEIDCTYDQYIDAFVRIFWPNPDVIDLLPEIRKNYRLLLASNTNEAHYQQFRRQFEQDLQHFHFLGTSFEAKARKPKPAFYQYIFERANCDKSECLFVDDLPANVEAAREFGWQGLVYSRGSKLSELLLDHGIRLG
jgi:putative hydrolase of the HAD superfamily